MIIGGAPIKTLAHDLSSGHFMDYYVFCAMITDFDR